MIFGPHEVAPYEWVSTSDVWTSVRELDADLRRYGGNSAYREMTAGIYDIEAWHATPLVEQKDPDAAFARFASIARDLGWEVVITPNPDLTTVPGARCGLSPGESQYDAFLRCDLTGQAAASADVVEIQAQGLETQPEDYRAFVPAAATQARDANPDVKVIAGLTTGQHASAAQMYEAWNTVRDLVDGYYLSINDSRVPTALAFVRLLPTSVTPSASPASFAVNPSISVSTSAARCRRGRVARTLLTSCRSSASEKSSFDGASPAVRRTASMARR